MLGFDEIVPPVSDQHWEALRWFAKRQGEDIDWPRPLDGLYLVNRAKGIHKPKGWKFALSVRQTIDGPYADREIIYNRDGSWEYDYFQEGDGSTVLGSDFTNKALMNNIEGKIPVAVLKQVKTKPNPKYNVVGLAMVTKWQDGYFHLKGFAPFEMAKNRPMANAAQYEPLSLEDARKWISSAIVMRQGAGRFRLEVLSAFGGKCAISGCAVEAVLEAAHIVPYLGTHTNAVSNALLLRSDLHTLFDRNLLKIEPLTCQVVLSDALKNSPYQAYDGAFVRFPDDSGKWQPALKQRADLLHDPDARRKRVRAVT